MISQSFRSYLGEDAICNLINSMIKENNYCTDIMKKHFNKECAMTKKDDEDFENSPKCWVCDNVYVDVDVKVRDHCHITGKYRGLSHRDFNINVKLNHKIPTLSCNLKKYDSHFIMQKLRKFNHKINIIPNGLEKHMSFNINNKVSFIDCFQFLSFSLGSLVKNLVENDFKYLGQEFAIKVIDIV